MSKEKKDSFENDLDVKFGTVSCNGTSAKIGVTVQRKDATRDLVDELFCNAQLDVDMRCDPNADDDAGGQGELYGDHALTVCGSPAVGSYSVYKDRYRTTLTFPDGAVAVDMLARFAKHPGKLLCTHIGEAKREEVQDDDNDEG